MSRKVTQAEPTKPRPHDPQGRELDGFGLPVSGPARLRRLAEMGRSDPNGDPDGWAASAKPKPPRKPKASRAPAPKRAPVVDPTPGSDLPAPETTEESNG